MIREIVKEEIKNHEEKVGEIIKAQLENTNNRLDRISQKNEKKGHLLLKRVYFSTKPHFLRILLQIKEPPVQGERIVEKIASLHRPLETYQGDEVEKIKVLD